jgi:hypothetical protein
MSKLRLFFLIILLPIVFFRCETNNPVPQVPVNFIIELNSPLYNVLNSPGSSIIIPNEGYKNHGVIVTRVNFDEFAAYDATCTYDPEDAWGRVELDASGIFAFDKICNSKFNLLYDGSVMNGPATVPLKMYNVDYNPNMNSIVVHN